MIHRFHSLDIVTRASIACAYSGVAWGLFWIPLRHMDAQGINGAWATVMFYGVPALFFTPWGIWNWRRLKRCGVLLHLIGISAGGSLALYSDAMLYTEIVRGIVLYYLTPVWSFLLARIMLGEVITPPRIAAVVLGISGMLILFEVDVGIPLPSNVGDWMGLLGGIGWAFAAVYLRKDDGTHALEICTVYFFYATLAGVAVALVPAVAGDIAVPRFADALAILPWFIPVAAVLVVSAAFAAFWGAPHLNPGLVGILFMTEISIGAITAAIWAGEPFGWRELAGVVLITMAGLSEYFYYPILRRLTPRP